MFTADELANIANSTLENYINTGKVFKNNVQNKPLLKAMDARSGRFEGGKDYVSMGVAAGQGGGTLAGYEGDDEVSYYNPTPTKRVKYAWKEHHIGTQITHSELKRDGIEVMEEDTADARTMEISGREKFVLAGLLEEKQSALGEDYAKGLNSLLWGDGSSDAKAIAGIRSVILGTPDTGYTGGLNRSAYSWWRNRAVLGTSSASTGGGVLINVLQKEWRQLNRYADGGTNHILLAGSDFIDAYEKEMRANGYYSQTGWSGGQDAAMGDVMWMKKPITYDPTLDDLSLSKYMYVLDLSPRAIQLLYLNGRKIQKHKPARPYNRYVLYNGLTTTAVLVAKRLNTSGVYSIN